ncbi:MAG: alginate export family protein [Burkholderiales bacterium]|nr:alginate export family protein [Burkholderiales bacterium]
MIPCIAPWRRSTCGNTSPHRPHGLRSPVRSGGDGRHLAFALLLAGAGDGAAAAAETAATPCPLPPAYLALRYEEDWSYLADPRCATDKWDRVKYMPFGEGRYVSLGGDARIRYERFENPGFGTGPDDTNGYLLQRYLLHADMHWNPRWRFFGQLESALEDGRNGGPRRTDENRLDVNQLFAEWTPLLRDTDRLSLRVGRQEVELGSAQFTSVRDGLNDRLSFDGIRLVGEVNHWRVHAMATRVVPNRIGMFDDGSRHDETHSGFFIARSHTLLPDGNAVAYASRRTRPITDYAGGNGPEQRYTVGTRWWGTGDHFDYSYEFGIQRGHIGVSDIRAWYVNTNSGWTEPLAWGRTRFGLRFSIGSGDPSPGDGTIGTFSPLFAATAYSGLAGLIGPSNSINLTPSMGVQIDENRWTTIGTSLFWRQSLADGIYNIATELLRPPGSSDARFVGVQPTLQYIWTPTRHVTINTTLSYFRTGTFLRETPPGENVTYFTIWWAYRF